jgi:ubiquitin-conjugating enzyme E2 J2
LWPHHRWQPSWSVGTIIQGLLSFMLDEDPAAMGSIEAPAEERKALAAGSLEFNRQAHKFREVFPDLCATDGAGPSS